MHLRGHSLCKFTLLVKIPATSAVSPGEVPALQHEVLDDPVELAAQITLPLRLLGQLNKVFHGLRHLQRQSNKVQ